MLVGMIPLVAVALVAAMLTGPPLPDDDEPDLFGRSGAVLGECAAGV